MNSHYERAYINRQCLHSISGVGAVCFSDITIDKYPMGVYNIGVIRRYMYMNIECCCTNRTKERSEAELRSLINRLNRIEGQIRGVRNMVETDAYCTDILMQVSAVNAALNAFSKELLANHIKTCVAEDIKKGNEETVDELVVTLQKLMK